MAIWLNCLGNLEAYSDTKMILETSLRVCWVGGTMKRGGGGDAVRKPIIKPLLFKLL